MAYALTLEREDVENVLSCLDAIAAGEVSDFTRIGIVPLIAKIERQTGIAKQQHAPREVPAEVIERFRRRAEALAEEDAKRVGVAPVRVETVCSSHPIELMGETCPRCGRIA